MVGRHGGPHLGLTVHNSIRRHSRVYSPAAGCTNSARPEADAVAGHQGIHHGLVGKPVAGRIAEEVEPADEATFAHIVGSQVVVASVAVAAGQPAA